MTESAEDTLARVLADQRADHLTYVADAVSDFTVSRADLFYVFDAHGAQFLDLSAGDGVMVTGHYNIPVLGAIHDQLANYEHTARSGEHIAVFASAYAKAISATFPEVDEEPQQVLFCASEFEARHYAIELARASTDDNKIVTLTDQPGVPGGSGVITPNYAIPDPIWWGNTAAVILELINPDMTPVDEVWSRMLSETIERHGVLTIVDESRTGYGRTGSIWMHQQYGMSPDITILGGAGGGGLPFGAVVAPRRVFDSYMIPRRQFGASPAICRAGSVVLEQISPALLEHVIEAGHTFDDAVASLRNQFPDLIGGSHGIGLAKGLVLTTEQIARRFFTEAVAHGLLLRPPTGRVITVTPPLMISEEEVRRAVDLMADACLDWTDPL